MCHKNRSQNSASYLNAQLSSLWVNAERCAKDPGTERNSEAELGICLYEFFGPQDSNLGLPTAFACYAKFGKPHIEFVCNHEIILMLNITQGRCNTNTNTNINDLYHSNNKEFEFKMGKTVLAFRMEFSEYTIPDIRCHKIGDRDYLVNLLILDIATATYCREKSDTTRISTASQEIQKEPNAFVHYIATYYLPLLKRAGLHVLHSLPDFGSSEIPTIPAIDYSVTSEVNLTQKETRLFGIEIAKINAHLKDLWREAVVHNAEYGFGYSERKYNHHLVEHETPWLRLKGGEDGQFHMSFGPMQIQPLCKREAILYFNLYDVGLMTADVCVKYPESQFTGWKVAIITDVTFEETEEGSVSLSLDLDSSRIRYCDHRCEGGASVPAKETLVEYLTTHYVDILRRAGHQRIYREDERIPLIDGDDGCLCKEGSCGLHQLSVTRWDHSQTFHCHGFDQVFAVTEGSLNTHLRRMWYKAPAYLKNLESRGEAQFPGETKHYACLANLSSTVQSDIFKEKLFKAELDAPRIHLAYEKGSQNVIFYLSLKKGIVSHNKEIKYSFSNWILAFALDMQLVETIIDNQTVKQLTLNFKSAKFRYELSTVPDLLQDTNYRLVRSKFEVILRYIKRDYFDALSKAGLHLLIRISMFQKDSYGSYSHSLTDIKFQIYRFRSPSAKVFGGERQLSDRNMILFLGMYNSRKMPTAYLPNGQIWTGGYHAELLYGAICVSREFFLESHILTALTELNRRTTIVPGYPCVDSGSMAFDLISWNEHPIKKNSKNRLEWTRVDQNTDDLKYKWFNTDEWRYNHQNNFGNNGEYLLKCETKNYLAISTGPNIGGCSITLRGGVEVTLSYTGESGHWSSNVSASWAAPIEIGFNAINAKHVYLPHEVQPTISGKCKHDLGRNAYDSVHQQLREHFSLIGLQDVVDKLNTSFVNILDQVQFNGSGLIVRSSTFNNNGDLLLEFEAKPEHEEQCNSNCASKEQIPDQPQKFSPPPCYDDPSPNGPPKTPAKRSANGENSKPVPQVAT